MISFLSLRVNKAYSLLYKNKIIDEITLVRKEKIESTFFIYVKCRLKPNNEVKLGRSIHTDKYYWYVLNKENKMNMEFPYSLNKKK